MKVLGSRGFDASGSGLAPFLMKSCLIAFLLGLTLLVGCGGGGGTLAPPSSGTSGSSGGGTPPAPPPTGNTAVLVRIGDFVVGAAGTGAIIEQIVSFGLTIDSVSLRSWTGNSSQLIFPRRLELSRLAGGKFEPLVLAHVAQGSYGAIDISVSDPEISFIDSNGVLHENVAASLTSATGTITRSFSIGPSPVFLTLNPLAGFVSIGEGNAVVVTPRFGVAGPFEVQNGAGVIDDLVGRFAYMTGGNSFIMDAVGSGIWDPLGGDPGSAIEFETNSTTAFQGITEVNALTEGMTLEVDANLYADGTLRAAKVEVENSVPSKVVAEGLALKLALAQLQMLVREVHRPDGVTWPTVGKVLTVNGDASTQFRVESEHVDLKNLAFTPAFDALTMAAWQNVRVAASGGSATTVTADQLKLEEQTLDGTAGALTPGSVSGQFSLPLTVSADSAFAKLTGHSSVLVTVQPATWLDTGDPMAACVSCISGKPVRVRGLLFFSGGQYRLVAESLAVN